LQGLVFWGQPFSFLPVDGAFIFALFNVLLLKQPMTKKPFRLVRGLVNHSFRAA
jgi:hypothetical protein